MCTGTDKRAKRQRWYRICQVSGDPHYVTFDDHVFDYESTCISVAAKTTFNQPRQNLEPFSVSIENEHIGGVTRVAWFKRAIVRIYDTTFVFSKGRKVTVNGIEVNPPFSMASKGLTVSLSGINLVMTTRFGLQIVYNGVFNFFIRLSKAYGGFVEGLCGNFNGNTSDDAMSNSLLMTARTSRYIHRNSCIADEAIKDLGACPQMSKYKVLCEIVNSNCFETCRRSIMPSNVLRNCIFDLCETRGNHLAFEQAISAYADRCQARDFAVCDWRNQTGITVDCPSYSHFEHEGSSCPNTCRSPTQSSRCTAPKVSGCVCNTGYVLSGAECVPLSKCGCSADGKYYKDGQKFYLNECTSLCTCVDAKISCHSSSCGEENICGLSFASSQLACLPIENNVCRLTGGSHYTSFDGRKFNFQGNCLFLLATLNDLLLGVISINAENVINTERDRVAFETKSIQINFELNSQNVNLKLGVLLDNQPAAKVDGLFLHSKVTDSYTSRNVEIYKSGFRIFARIGNVTISYGFNEVRITLNAPTSNQMKGMCGNFNGNSNDDFLMRNGSLTTNVEEFGNSYKVQNCDSIKTTTFECPSNKNLIYKGQNFCEKIKSSYGPFKNCPVDETVVSASYQNCAYDVCASNGSITVLTNALANTAYECQEYGDVSLCDWRKSTDSPPVECPRNSHYVACASACPDSCLRPLFQNRCTKPNTEDCQCDFGFIWSEGKCIKPEECGCYPETLGYVAQGYSKTEAGCKRKCSCNGPNKWECETTSCGDGNTCVKVGSNYQCVPPIERETCILWGESYVSTFDHSQFNFNGNCTYVLTKYDGDINIPKFSVIAQKSLKKENGMPGYKLYISTKNVTSKTRQELNVTIETDARLIYANGLQVNPGTSTDEYKVLRQGAFTVVKYHFGLIVRSSTRYSGAIVTLARSLESKVSGLCGTFDNNPDNDFFKSESDAFPSEPSTFGNFWRYKDVGILESQCVDATLITGSYSEHKCQNRRYLRGITSDRSCGILNDVTFNGCRESVPPQALILSCIASACHFRNYFDVLEENIMGYNVICSVRGHEVPSTRDISGTDFDCPINSTYVEKMPACIPTCDDPDVLKCKSDIDVSSFIDTEGCLCDEGFLLSGDKCVPIEFCGCEVPESKEYMQYGQCLWNENCTKQCQCRYGELNCEENSCYGNQYCGIRNGFHGCHYEDECRYENGGCSHVCTSVNRTVTCKCPDEMYLVNGRTCIPGATCIAKQSISCQERINQLETSFQNWRIKYYKQYLMLVENYKNGVDFTKSNSELLNTLSNCHLSWSQWFDTDDPTGCGDDETVERIHQLLPGKLCANTVAIDTRIINKTSNAVTSTQINLRENNANKGLFCDNADQLTRTDCPDYEVRFLCEVCPN